MWYSRFFIGSFVLLTFLSTEAFAQKAAVSSAFNFYKYNELDKAKRNIDGACEHVQTKSQARTWYYKGLISQAIFDHKTFSGLDSVPLENAFEAYKKALELEPSGEFSDDIRNRLKTVAYFSGVEEYKKKNYARALGKFDYLVTQNPSDTLALLYAAYCADYSDQIEKAVQCYQKLIEMRFKENEPEKSNIYLELGAIYKEHIKDTAKALEIIGLGRKRYPEASNLIREEANLYILRKQYIEALERLEKALEQNPDDEKLHVVFAGILEHSAATYDNKSGNGKSNVDQAGMIANAETHYKKALELKPDYFDANFNLGAMFFNQGADLMNAANQMKSDTEYKAAKNKAEEKFKDALPYLEKANKIQPEDKSTLISLKQLYIRMGEKEKYDRVKLELDRLK